MQRQAIDRESVIRASNRPIREQVIDHLADAMFEIDETLGMLQLYEAMSIRWIEPDVQKLYNQVNALMQKLTD